VRNTVPELSFKAVSLGLALFTSAIAPALADEPPCPDSTVATSAPLPAKSERPPTDAPITIESDDNNFEFDVKGNAKLCGHVVMRQGDRVIRADCLEYNAGSQSAKLTGGVEYSDPALTVRGNSGTYSPLGRTSRARSSGCLRAARADPPPACASMARADHARRRQVHHRPANIGPGTGQSR
jgi:hypothetical protein